jgi:predicted nucleic-acid-binding Zn-ribbon protein
MTDFDDLRQQLDLLNDENLLSILLQRDYEQWRPEVFDIVASILRERGVSISMDSGPEDEEQISEAPAGMHLNTVASYFSLADAEADLEALEAKGIRAWLFDADAPQTERAGESVQLKVLPEDFKAAFTILDSEPAPVSALPDEIAAPPCPKCGSRQITEEAEIVESSDGSSRSYRPTPKEAWFYKCNACGYTWSVS